MSAAWDANSSEFDTSTQHRLIYKLRELLGVEEMGGTMRLGGLSVRIGDRFRWLFRIYGEREISERHRHRYEFNREYEELLTSYGLRIVGNSPDRNFVEIVELADHPWFPGLPVPPRIQVQASQTSSPLCQFSSRRRWSITRRGRRLPSWQWPWKAPPPHWIFREVKGRPLWSPAKRAGTRPASTIVWCEPVD